MKHDSKSDSQFRNFIFLSVLLHGALLTLTLLMPELPGWTQPKNTVEISFIEPETRKPHLQVQDTAKMVVESDSKNANEQLSEKAKYLSEKSNTVEKETKAKSGKEFVNSKPAAAKAQQAKAQQKSAAAKPQLFAKSFDAEAVVARNESREQRQQQAREALMAGKAAPESSTNDSLPEAQDDLITRLNTKEYKYYSYYSRIKSQLNQWWVPKVQQKFNKMLNQGRTIASEENKVTKLIIVLNTAGNLVTVQVLAESGVRDLDDAAIEAFRSAAPFPNPPKGMIESDGTVKIRWDCVVES